MTLVYVSLCLLALSSGLAVILLIKVLTDDESRPTYDYPEDSTESPDEISEFPSPAIHVTRWGIHRDHLKRGFETEAGCPVCYEFNLHVH